MFNFILSFSMCEKLSKMCDSLQILFAYSQIITHWQSADCHSLLQVCHGFVVDYHVSSIDSVIIRTRTLGLSVRLGTWWLWAFLNLCSAYFHKNGGICFVTVHYLFQFSQYYKWKYLKNTQIGCILVCASYC